ncbi:Uncharacterized protein APZ42_019149 [Daphnia magna]|uniref:Endonuclease/exonuclease/phosphatase domain-containing protein n=1 Tax=Daphnia magna TaxID=35525 RepID=A0A164YJA7_9CRUS|nr:Uncharacterized protein APZ42_019149 [Daphnia magna]
MQTEIRGLKTELGKIKNLERTVASLEKSIEISQQSQDRLEKKFDIMSHKLEQFIIRLGINIDSTEPTRSSDSESEMEEEPIDETPVLTRSIIPFNARSLTRTTLTQFKAHMHQHKPHIATLSETFWKDSFEVKFKDYYVIKKNRQGQVGGGVAILVHKSVQHTTIALPHLSTIEATAISIFVDGNRTGRELMIISLYIPDGSKCNEEDLDILANASDNTILSGDFNAHHERWQGGCRHPNRSGSLIAGLLDRLDQLTLATPKDLGTRQCYNSFTTSTIDLTIMPPYLAATSKITRGPDLGSDHFPIHIEIGVQATKTGNRVPRWILKDADWITWNTQISGRINNSEFYSSQDSEVKYLILREAMIQSAQHSNIRMSKLNQQISAHSTNPWWNEKCKAAVAKARRAKNACDPKKGGICCVTNKTIWRRLDNEKKRIIKEEKENTFNIFINNLNPRCSTTKTWAFVKSMVAKAPPPDYNSSPIKNPDNNELVTTQKEKAEIFAKQYNYQKENLPDNQHYEQLINVRTNSQQCNGEGQNPQPHDQKPLAEQPQARSPSHESHDPK